MIDFRKDLGWKRSLVIIFLIIGLIIGPFYSAYLLDRYYFNPVKENSINYDVSNKISFFEENKTLVSEPLITSKYINYKVSAYGNDIYSFIIPDGDSINSSVAVSFSLLDYKMSDNLQNVKSIKLYSLPKIKIPPYLNDRISGNPYIGTQYSRPIYDGSRFWAIFNPVLSHNFTKTLYPRMISFNINGSVLSNNTLDILNVTSNENYDFFNFFGAYKNYLVLGLYNKINISENRLIFISKTNFNESTIIPIGNITISSQKYSLLPFIGNADDSNLWIYSQPFNYNKPTLLVGLSLSDLFNQQNLTVNKLVNFDDVSGPVDKYITYQLPINKNWNETIGGQNDLFTSSSPYIYGHSIIFQSFLPIRNYPPDLGASVHLFAGTGIINLNYYFIHVSSFEVFVNGMGWLLCVSETVILVKIYFQEFKSKRNFN